MELGELYIIQIIINSIQSETLMNITWEWFITLVFAWNRPTPVKIPRERGCLEKLISMHYAPLTITTERKTPNKAKILDSQPKEEKETEASKQASKQQQQQQQQQQNNSVMFILSLSRPDQPILQTYTSNSSFKLRVTLF